MRRILLPLQTSDLIVGFMVWVILSSLLPFIQEDIPIPVEAVSLVTAIPVVLGSVLRVPFGYLTDLVGARIMFSACFVSLIVPVCIIGWATTYLHLIIGGIFLGIGGAVFSIGVTSLPKYFPEERQGFANGVYGFGNLGTALTTFLAPVLAAQIGWVATVRSYLVLLVVAALANLVLGDRHERRTKLAIAEQLRQVSSDAKLWAYSLFYFVTFGAFVAFTVFLPNHLYSFFGAGKVEAGMMTGIFIVIAAVVRVIGGWLGDRFDCLSLLKAVFICMGTGSLVLAFSSDFTLFLAGIYLIALSCGVGNGVVFKMIPSDFKVNRGIVNGVVSMMGGLGGFFPPIILALSLSSTQAYTAGFIGFTCSIIICLAVSWAMGSKAAKQMSQGNEDTASPLRCEQEPGKRI